MTLGELLVLLIVAGICGAIGEAIAGYSHLGCFASVAVGFIGALFGTWLARRLGIPEYFAVKVGTVNFPIIWSIIGAALFVAVIGLLRRSRA
jgi:uncharacterized membrane protein YeaQ/YmgE (transglycosylase-associated protein family)